MHPSATIEPTMANVALPPTGYGQAAVVNAADGTVRNVAATDTALTAIYGITVRPFPFQQSVTGAGSVYGSTGFGTTAPPPGEIDILRAGYIMVPVVGATVKGGAVFVWIAATAAPHVQGGFEAVATAGSTIALADPRTTFNGTPDANQLVEIAYNI
jgi:hypothetical protein